MERDTSTERLIFEIRRRPCIWDSTSQEYTNRDLKKKGWEEIVNVLGGQELSIDEKRYLGLMLQRRWKGIRSCYLRELKRQKTGPMANRKTEYTYFKQLHFLQKVITVKDTLDGDDEHEGDEEGEGLNDNRTFIWHTNREDNPNYFVHAQRRDWLETHVSGSTTNYHSRNTSPAFNRRAFHLKRTRSSGEPERSYHLTSTKYNDDDEFDVFGRNISLQLKKLPLSYALESQELIQRILKEQRIKALQKQMQGSSDYINSRTNQGASSSSTVPNVPIPNPVEETLVISDPLDMKEEISDE